MSIVVVVDFVIIFVVVLVNDLYCRGFLFISIVDVVCDLNRNAQERFSLVHGHLVSLGGVVLALSGPRLTPGPKEPQHLLFHAAENNKAVHESVLRLADSIHSLDSL